MTRRRLLLPTLLALTVSAFAQKMQTPAGEAPGPWILGTIGIGPQPYTARKGGAEPAKEMPPGSQIALKGFAIKVGEHGEAAVAYDLDLCRMAGAWVGKFTTPMNLMSRGEYPTALGEVAFTTGEVPGFLTFGSDSGAKKAVFQGKGSAPISGGGAVPASGGGVPPSGGVAAPQGGAPISSGGSAPASGGVGGRAGTAPISRSEAPIPRGGAPFSASDAPAASGDAPAARNSAPAAAGGAPAANGGGIPEAKNGDSPLRDPRPEPFGPLPPGQARFRGFYVNGDKTILKWDIGGVEVLEMPGCENRDGICFFTRSLEVQPSENPIDIYLGIEPEERGEDVSLGEMGLSMIASKESPGYGVLEFMNSNYRNRFYSISIQSEETEHLGLPYDRIFLSPSERILHLLPRKATTRLRFAYWSSSDRQEVAAFREVLFAFGRQVALLHLADLAHGGPARWPEPVVTTGELSKDTASAYVVDTIKLRDPNPWGAPMFVGGFDFFERGAAATAAAGGGRGAHLPPRRRRLHLPRRCLPRLRAR